MAEAEADTWEREGTRLASLIEGISAVVVAGTDPAAAASFAVGLARVHGRTRRVAIADLVGNAPALEELGESDDPHGISDSFRYGVSLNKIARPMVGVRNVFVMPSGSEPVAIDTVYSNFRWRRLSAGFHQVDALLIVVALPGTAGFADLCTFVGALLPVGDTAFPPPPGVPILAPPPPPVEAPPLPPPRATAARAREVAAVDQSGRRSKRWALLALYGAGAVTAGALLPKSWWASGPTPIAATAPESRQIVVAAAFDSTAAGIRSASGDSLAADSARLARAVSRTDSTLAVPPSVRVETPPAATAPAPVPVVTAPVAAVKATSMVTVMNPADSARATKYSVYLATANSLVAALPDRRVSGLPGVAISPVTAGTEQGFRVTIGAFSSRPAADSLLTRLRAEKLIASGSVLKTPYAFLLDEGLLVRSIRSRTEAYAQRAIIAYGLIQADGSAMMYTGAFESPKQATTLAVSLRAIGITPVLVYRTGRTF